MTNPPPTLLTLPLELRSRIFYLALVDKPLLHDPDDARRYSLDLSLLSTNRQVYYETRAIPFALHHFGAQYHPEVNFLSSLRLQPLQLAALKILIIEYLNPSDMAHFLALGSDNGYLFGDNTLDLDVLTIYADDWIGSGARRWRYSVSRGDVHYGLPRSSTWLKALCGLKGWKQLEIGFRIMELVDEYHSKAGFIQPLFDDFKSCSESLDEGLTIWHESQDRWEEKITVFRTKELGRFKSPQWWKGDLEKLLEGRECILREAMDTDEEEGQRPAFHVQERHGRPGDRKAYCARCLPDPEVRSTQL